jgi:nitroreductase
MSQHPSFEAARWHAAIAGRRSRRVFDGTPIGPHAADALRETAASFRPYPDARVVYLADPPADLFTGIAGSYGRVTDAPAALVFIEDGRSSTAEEHCGYTGEGVVLEAHALGLETCWIAGTFSAAKARALVTLEPGEVVRGVSPLGHGTATAPFSERLIYGAGAPKKRRPLDEIAPGHETWPEWAREGVEAARIAPSAVNRQPWRFRYENGSVTVRAHGIDAPKYRPRLDCGIAMLHFELGARSAGGDGAWVPLSAPDVARWEPLD